MNGPHDLGGMQAFGPVQPERDEPWFHAAWERRAFALTLAMGGTASWSLDASRHARESIPPARYLAASYYAIWLQGLERLLIERGLVTPAELADGAVREPPRPPARVLRAADVPGVLARGSPTLRSTPAAARFAPGDAVRARNLNPLGHTRLPRYARGRPGVVEAVHGAHVFPDTHAHGLGESPQWLYTVSFDAQALWGPDTTASAVCVDCWEPYLEPDDAPARGA